MTKKDYKKIAEVLKVHKPEQLGYISTEMLQFNRIVTGFTVMLLEDNNNFDKAKFRKMIYG